MEITVVVGHYFRISKQEKLRPESRMTCANTSCKNHKSRLKEKFCGQCGDPVQKMIFNVPASSNNPSDLLPGDLSDIVSAWEYADPTVWGINLSIPGAENSHFEENGNEAPIVITGELIAKQREAILNNEKIKQLIEYMHQHYGGESAELVYGAFSYAS